MENLICTKDLIFEVAFYKFLENGYENTNLRDIATEVNIKAASIYFHFKSKEDLFIYVFNTVVSDIYSELQYIIKLSATESYKNQLYLYFKHVIKCCIDDSSRYKFLLRYKLFPSFELQEILTVLFKKKSDQEFEIVENILNGFIKEDENKHLLSPRALFMQYKRFEERHINEMLIGGIISTDDELNLAWSLFNNYQIDKFI
ncbi:TetR/AcrR family transcriptional regulator [Fusibacter bizertensis]